MIELSNQDGVAILRMADGKANAMTIDFCEAMTERFEEVRTSSARAVVIIGSGKIFSAGVDLLRLQEGGRPYIRKFLPALSTMFETVFSHPKPVVAAINGHAVAGGCVLACAADKRLMARDTGRIGVTELLVGVPFPAIAMEIMRHATAPQYFEDAIFSGATYLPTDAVVRGMANELVDPVVLLDRAVAAAKTLAALPPAVFVLTKRQTRQSALERLESVGRAVDAAVEEIWTAPETLERIRDYVARTFKKDA
ncbi:MAG TPA: enoyl-CoA hydratase/isomerase family protein [Xanthobacteraceae bacterium]|nr:enoyl-CoA hydratase/isomerase family protein [Xanthobacteraceae bacterium]